MAEIDWSESKEAAERTSLGQSLYWLKAIAFQGQRVFDAEKQPVKHSNSVLYNSRSKMEEMFFLIACQKAVRWIEPMKLDTAEAARFLEFADPIKMVRDEREHDEDRYGLGNKFDTSISPHEHALRGHIFKKGKARGHKFRMELADTPARLMTSLSGTVLSGGRRLLGGVLDVLEVMKAAEALITVLLVIQHKNSDLLISKGRPMNEKKAAVAESYYIEPYFLAHD